MIKESVAKILETNGIGTVGSTIFIGEIPVDLNGTPVNNAFCILNAPSATSDKAIRIYNSTLDFWGRFTNSDTGFNKMQQIYDFFHGKYDYELDGFHVYFSFSPGSIMDFDRDAERRKMYKLSVTFIFRIEEEVS